MVFSRCPYFSIGLAYTSKRENYAVLKKYAYIFLFLLFWKNSFSQTLTLPPPINEIHVNCIASGPGSIAQRENVGLGTEMDFSVLAETIGVGCPENNEFHWIVYGGRIGGVIRGTMLGTVNNCNEKDNEISDVVTKGWRDGKSTIKIKWQSFECENAFIAVRQDSEYGCSDDIYSIFYVNVRNNYLGIKVVPQASACAMATDNFVSFDISISNFEKNDYWRFKYEFRTCNTEGVWSEWQLGSASAINIIGDPDYGYVMIPAGKENEKYTLNIPLTDNNKIKGSGDFFLEIRITDVRDAQNRKAESLAESNATVLLHKIPKTDFGIKAD